MLTTTDPRTISSRDIALDPKGRSGQRLLARVLEKYPDGTLRLELLTAGYRAFYKDGHLTRHSQGKPEDLGAFNIVWQGRLNGHGPSQLAAGYEKVSKAIARKENGIIDYDDMPVTISRGTLRALTEIAARRQLEGLTPEMLEEARKAAI